MAVKTLEEWFFERKVNFKNHGKFTYMGIEAKQNLARANKIYEEEIAYHNLNPSNSSSALAVKRAKENVDYWQMRFDTWN